MRYRKSGPTQAQERDLGRGAEADGHADRANAVGHVATARRLTGGCEAIQARDEWRAETGRIQVLVKNLHIDLTTVRVAGKNRLITTPNSRGEHVRVVGKKNIGCAGNDHAFRADQIFRPVRTALIIDARDVENALPAPNLRGFAAEKIQASGARLELQIIPTPGVGFVISHATEHAVGASQANQFADRVIE